MVQKYTCHPSDAVCRISISITALELYRHMINNKSMKLRKSSNTLVVATWYHGNRTFNPLSKDLATVITINKWSNNSELVYGYGQECFDILTSMRAV